MNPQAKTQSAVAAEAPSSAFMLRRKCDCGNHTTSQKCGACEKEKHLLQRRKNQFSDHGEVPSIVHDVLRSPGQGLDARARAFMEPRLGQDFSRVRVHTDAQAASSAQAVNALAYTVGHHVVFGAGRYQPHSEDGRRLLAHELTHVQQAATAPTGSLVLGDPHSEAEGHADQVAAQINSQHSLTSGTRGAPRRAVTDSRPALRRWKISGNTATSDSETDTLGRLAQKAGAHFNDWKCIKPLSQRTSKLPTPPGNFDARYELYVQNGDTFDISNLTATSGSSLRIYLFDDASQANDAAIAKKFYPGMSSSGGADNDIENAANSGNTPISDFVVFGHAAGDSMWGGASTFTPNTFNPEEEVQTFTLAEAGIFPRRCWFTRNATSRSVGCDSEAWGQDFAAHYLRKGASVITTTKSVRPKCKTATASGGCTSYDGLDFASSSSAGGTMLDGPFYSVGDFHAGRFWKTINGKL
jgi:Domain of unknown function (DUF4157)